MPPAGWRPPTPFSRDNQPSREAKSAGQAVAAEIRARIAAHKEAIIQAQLERALSQEHPQGHQAAKDLLDRIMPPAQSVDVTTDGQPLVIERRIIDVANPGHAASVPPAASAEPL